MLNNLIVIVITSIIPYIIGYFSERNRYIGVFIENRINVKRRILYFFTLLVISSVMLIIDDMNLSNYWTFLKSIIDNNPILVICIKTITLFICIILLVIFICQEYVYLFKFKYKYRDEQFFELIEILSKKHKKEKKNTYLRDISSLIEYMFNDIDKDLQRPYNTSGKRNIDSIIKALNTIDDLIKIDLDKSAIRSILKKASDEGYCEQEDIDKIKDKLKNT